MLLQAIIRIIFIMQLLAETGVIGFMLGCVMISQSFLFVWSFFETPLMLCATSWIIH